MVIFQIKKKKKNNFFFDKKKIEIDILEFQTNTLDSRTTFKIPDKIFGFRK